MIWRKFPDDKIVQIWNFTIVKGITVFGISVNDSTFEWANHLLQKDTKFFIDNGIDKE